MKSKRRLQDAKYTYTKNNITYVSFRPNGLSTERVIEEIV